MNLNLKYPPTPEFARKHAELCVVAAKNASDVNLDFTPESLKLIDEIIEGFRCDGIQPEQVAETLFTFGCYVGEVFVRNAGGTWRKEDETKLKGLAGFFMVMELGPDYVCNPIAKVFKRLQNGIEDNIPYFYAVFTSKLPVAAPTREEKQTSWLKSIWKKK